MTKTVRTIILTSFMLIPLCYSLDGQSSPDRDPQFEVSSVKQSVSSSRAARVDLMPNRQVSFINAPLKLCIEVAYDLPEYAISGPDWLQEYRYNIEAKAPAGTGKETLLLMARNLLVERFKLAAHLETRILPVYALTVAKDGPKIARAQGDEQVESKGFLVNRLVTMKDLTRLLSTRRFGLDRPVINMTHLEGTYKITLSFTQGSRSGRGSDSDDVQHESIFDAVRNQLGLALTASKAPVDILVIDHAEQVPVAN